MTTGSSTTSPIPTAADIAGASQGYKDAILLSRTPEKGNPAEQETRSKISAHYKAAQGAAASPADKAYLAAFKEVGSIIKERNDALKASEGLKAKVEELHGIMKAVADQLVSAMTTEKSAA